MIRRLLLKLVSRWFWEEFAVEYRRGYDEARATNDAVAACHLAWLHARLVNVHGEDPRTDYMRRLDEISTGLMGRPVTFIDQVTQADIGATRGELV